MDLAHPGRVALGQVVVRGDEVDALARERVEVRGQRGDERLALTGLHLRDPAEVQGGAAHDLDVEVALAEHPLGGLADRGERLGEQLVEVLAVGRRAGGTRRSARRAPRRSALHLRLERGDLGNDRLEELELAPLADVEDLLEETHCAESTGAPPVPGRGNAERLISGVGAGSPPSR